ncbi:MAG TPA: cell division protein ZapB [Thermoanaerobaculia bacterium]|nr:cell division protein ZapB [Thermoanaerobaculia bacterium]
MSIEWLEELETRVREAAERLRELKEENSGLQERIEELETKLSAVTVEPAEGSGELAEAREENESLRQQIADLELKLARSEEVSGRERDEIRGRVEKLTRHLEELVG